MKTKFLSILLLSSVMMVNCTYNPGNPEEAVQETITPEKRIIQILVDGSKDNTTNKYTVEYDEKGRVAKVVSDNPEVFETFVCTYDTEIGVFRMGNISGLLNYDGTVISSKHHSDIMLDFVGDMVYNDIKQLISVNTPDLGKMTLKWKNNDMTKIKVMGHKIFVSYTSLENKNKFGVPFGFYAYNLGYHIPIFPYYRLLGKPTKHLPSSVGSKKRRHSFQYITDKDGYVKEMMVIPPDNIEPTRFSFVYE